MQFISEMAKLNFLIWCSKTFETQETDLALMKHFLFLSVLDIFVETVILVSDFFECKVLNNNIYASLLSRSIDFFLKM